MRRFVSAPYLLAVLIAAVALAYRVILLRTNMTTIDSDQAVSGIMSLHILQGDHPIFFYDQSYNGAIEQYLTAGVFRLFGASDFTLRLVPTLAAAALAAQVFGLAWRLYGPRVALAAGLWIAIAPPVLIIWTAAAGAGYIAPTVLGTAMLIIFVRRWGLGRPRRYDIPALGVLAGLGVWEQPMIVNYVAALAVAALPYLWRARRRLVTAGLRYGPALAACFAVGAAPWLAYAAEHPAATLAAVSRRGPAVALADVLRRLVVESWPVLSGGAQPTGYSDQFARYVGAHSLPYALSLLCLGYLALRLVLSPHGLPAQVRALAAGRPRPDAVVAVLAFAVVAIYLASSFKSLAWTTRNPRYLLPLYSATPYLWACLLPGGTAMLRRAREQTTRLGREIGAFVAPSSVLLRVAAVLVVVAAVGANLYGGTRMTEVPSAVLPDVTPLVHTLEARGDGAVYADYWIAWRMAFASHERLLPVVTIGLRVDHHPRGARYPAYLPRAARVRRWAYILPPRLFPAFARLLRRHHVPFTFWRWGSDDLFYYHWGWGRPVIVDGPVRPHVSAILSA